MSISWEKNIHYRINLKLLLENQKYFVRSLQVNWHFTILWKTFIIQKDVNEFLEEPHVSFISDTLKFLSWKFLKLIFQKKIFFWISIRKEFFKVTNFENWVWRKKVQTWWFLSYSNIYRHCNDDTVKETTSVVKAILSLNV